MVIYFKKKEQFTLQEKQEASPNLGDRWTFTAVIPESSYLHTVYNGQRTKQEAEAFIQKIKVNSDGQAPLFESDVGPPMRMVL